MNAPCHPHAMNRSRRRFGEWTYCGERAVVAEQFSVFKYYRLMECTERTVFASIRARTCPNCGQRCDSIYTLKAHTASDDAFEVAANVAFVHCRVLLSVNDVATEPAQRTWEQMRTRASPAERG